MREVGFFTEEALSNLKKYNDLKTIYEDEWVNQVTHQFLNRMSQQKINDNPQLNKYPLMQYLSNAWKVMMMTEFEIATWAVYLDDYKLDENTTFTVEDYIMNTAFFVKMFLNNEDYLEPMFNSYFNWYIHSFISKFNNWIKVKQPFEFDPIKVNAKFKKLNKPYNPQQDKDFIDYNHWVDDILQISPPYNYCGNEKEENKTSKSFQIAPSVSQKIDESVFSSQRSIVPTKKKIQTYKFDATPQQINWGFSEKADNDLLNRTWPMTRLAKKKSSTFSITDIKIDNSMNNPSQILNQQVSNFYGLEDNGASAEPLDNMFLSSRPSRPTPLRLAPNISLQRSISGFSNLTNSNDYGNNKSSQMQLDNQNLFTQLQNIGLAKIPIQDLSRFDIDEKGLNDIPDIPNISSRGNSFQMLLRNDPTPSLFRGTSSIVDFKKKI